MKRGMKFIQRCVCTVANVTGMLILSGNVDSWAQQTVLPEDPPEEMLQLEILLPAHSPQTGEAESPAAYAQTQDRLQVKADAVPPQLPSAIPATVDSLRLLKLLKGLIPFL